MQSSSGGDRRPLDERLVGLTYHRLSPRRTDGYAYVF
jgi:hypothetical protein